MFVPTEILLDLFPVDGFDVNVDHDYFQSLFTDSKLTDSREKFLDAADKIWEGLLKAKKVQSI